MIFNKCIKEPNYIDLYMEIVDQLFAKFKANKDLNFKRLFLNYCQEKLQAQDNDILLIATGEEDDDTVMKKKERIMGSMRLIGELFVRGAVPDEYVKQCLDTLMNKALDDNVDSAVCLLRGIGKRLYQYFAFEAKLTTMTKRPKLRVKKFTKEMLDDYIDRLVALRQTDKLSSRVKFAIQDLVDAKNKDWSNAFDRFPVPKQPGKAKEDIVAYRKKTKSTDRPEPPQTSPSLPATKVEAPERKTGVLFLGKELDRYHKSHMDEKNRVYLCAIKDR